MSVTVAARALIQKCGPGLLKGWPVNPQHPSPPEDFVDEPNSPHFFRRASASLVQPSSPGGVGPYPRCLYRPPSKKPFSLNRSRWARSKMPLVPPRGAQPCRPLPCQEARVKPPERPQHWGQALVVLTDEGRVEVWHLGKFCFRRCGECQRQVWGVQEPSMRTMTRVHH